MNAYTQSDWEAEIAGLYERREAPAPCPHCGRTGFYGPRQNEERTRRYRFCKFCGFGQEVGAAAVMYRATVHGCPTWRRVAGAPYLWWVAPDADAYRCPYCGGDVAVAQALVTSPQHDPTHPWWAVPQGLTRAAAAAYWEGQGYFRLYL